MSDDTTDKPNPVPRPSMESVNARVIAMDTNVHGERLTVVTLLLDNGHIICGDALYTGTGKYDPIKASAAAFERAIDRLYQLEVYLWAERKWQSEGCPSVIPVPPPDDSKIITPGSTPLTLVKP